MFVDPTVAGNTRPSWSRRVDSAQTSWLTSTHAFKMSLTVRAPERVADRLSKLAARRIASRLVPRTVRLVCTGRPAAPRPVNTRTSHTPGLGSRMVTIDVTLAE